MARSKKIHPKTLEFEGRQRTISEIAKIKGVTDNALRHYVQRKGSLEGFDERAKYGRRMDFHGELLTFNEIAARLGVKVQAARDFYRRHGNFDGCGDPTMLSRKGKPLKHLEDYYNTLDDSIPFDRILKECGYRSVAQFCNDNGFNKTLVCRWRRGLPVENTRTIYSHGRWQPCDVLDEMLIGGRAAFSYNLHRLLEATGRLEWELFPSIFTEDFYRRTLKRDITESPYAADCGSVVMGKDAASWIAKVLRTIPRNTRTAIVKSFGLDGCGCRTLVEIGQELHITRERARQLICKALHLLRSPSRLKLLKEVYGEKDVAA